MCVWVSIHHSGCGISIHHSGIANWVYKGSNRSSCIYTKDSIIKAVEYLIRNCYFKLGDKLFRQDIGIPMGSDPAPAWANLFLFHYESSWINSVKKSNNILARKFGQVFRYIDDLLALNDGHSFERHFHEIYPPELTLNAANNVAFICKRYYASVLMRELGLLGESTSTYTRLQLSLVLS